MRGRILTIIAVTAVIIVLVMQAVLLQRIAMLERQLEAASDDTQRQLAGLSAAQSQLWERTNSTETAVLGLQNSLLELQQDASTRIEGLQGQIRESQESIRGLQDQTTQVRSEDFSAIITDVLESTVGVRTNRGIGSGSIVHENGYVLTNYHVIQGITAGNIRTSEQQPYAMRIVATDPEHDLALLKISSNSTFEPLEFEDSDNVQVGERVIALGSPAGLDFTVTEGIVSAVDRETPFGDYFVQTDVPINPGSSGGPLVNSNGRIIGINTFKSRGYEGLGFAVESDVAQQFTEQAIAIDQAQSP